MDIHFLHPDVRFLITATQREKGASLAAVAHRELGYYLDKGQQTSNWASRPLDEAQRRYATADAEILLALRAALEGNGSPLA